MAVLGLHQPDARSHARLRDALGGAHRLLPCGSWHRLRDHAARERLDGCVIDPYGDPDALGRDQLRRFRRRFPEVAIVIYADFQGREMDLYHLGRMGVDGVILSRKDDSHRRIRRAVELALSSSLARRVTGELESVLPSLGIRSIEWSVENAGKGPQVPDLARHVRMSARALTRELRSMGLPPPRQLLLWGRLLQAARMLDAPGNTVEDVAFHLGYATGASLGRALKEHTGFSATELKEAGGVDAVLDVFVDAVLDGTRSEEPRRQWSAPGSRPGARGSVLGR